MTAAKWCGGALCLAVAWIAGLSSVQASPKAMTATSPTFVLGEPLSFADLQGWEQDDHAAALTAFKRSCVALVQNRPATRPGVSTPAALVKVCRKALLHTDGSSQSARTFFETGFVPHRIATDALMTGYFEPVLEGSLKADGVFQTPLLARPSDLVSFASHKAPAGWEPGLSAARSTPGGYRPYPTRADIDAGALGDVAHPVVFVRDPVDAFVIHVQGSARIHLQNGDLVRLAYDGRNGHPYTSIGRLAVERGFLEKENADMNTLTAWLRAHPSLGQELMHANASYIFFRSEPALHLDEGPIGGASVSLIPGRSIAIDRTLWPYGLPVWLNTTLPDAQAQRTPLQRLTIAHDTGSAIVGPGRVDYFVGSGPEAGRIAGLVRERVETTVLWPR